MARPFFDAVFGRLLDDGVELELRGGINFVGFTIEADEATDTIKITSPTGSLTSDDIDNESGVSGTTVSDALDTLNTAVGLRALASRTITAGAGMTGGGDLSADRTLNVIAHADGTITVNADSVQVGVLVAANYAANTIALSKLSNASAQFQIMARKTSSGGAWEDCSRSELGLALSATTITAGTNLSGGGDLSANRTLNVVATLTGITSINGVTLASPVEGTALTDADQTLAVSGGSNYVQSTALTANRTKTLDTSTGTPEAGEIITITRTTTAAFTLIVKTGSTTIYTFPASAKKVADFQFDGADWTFVGVKRIQ